MNFKLIATYDNYLLANMTMGMLTENNIKCQMKDENIVTVDPLLNPAVGGIKLLVEEANMAIYENLRKVQATFCGRIASCYAQGRRC